MNNLTHKASNSLDIDLNGLEQLDLFFVVGNPRSGTTLLQQMLDSNPSIQIPIESRWVVTLYRQFAKVKDWDNQVIHSFLEELYKDDAFRDFWNISRDKLTTKLLEMDPSMLNFPFLVKIIYLEYPSPFLKSTIQVIGDKNPPYSIYIDILLDIFPTAKFIHIVRDYRPNIVSNRKWFLRKNVASLACKWVAFNRQVEKHKRLFPTQFYTINYEDLARQPQESLKAITVFLGVPYDDNMLHYYKKSKSYKVEGRKLDLKSDLKGIHEKLASPVTAKNLDAWRNELTEKELRMADYIAGDFGEQYGYIKEHNTSSLGFALKKLSGRFSVFTEVFIKRFYHKYINIKTRRIIRVISHHAFKMIGMKNIFHPEGLKRT